MHRFFTHDQFPCEISLFRSSDLDGQRVSIYMVQGTPMTEGPMRCEESEGRLIVQVCAIPPIDSEHYQSVYLTQAGYENLQRLETPVNTCNFQLSDPDASQE